MQYRQLGHTGVQISPRSLGSMLMGGKTPDAEAHAIIDQVLDAVINVIDTANIYSIGGKENRT